MLKSFLLAGLLLAAYNLMPSVIPTAYAAASATALPIPAAPDSPAPIPAAETSAPAPPVVSLPPPPAVSPLAASDGIALTPSESEFITLINAERTSRGENALTVDPLLVTAARAHSREMCTLNYFDHQSPTAGLATPMDRYLKGLHETCSATPSYALVGENLFYCSVFDSHYNVEYGHEALMHSPEHRANILEPRFTKVGVGVYQDPSGQIWVTQMFLRDQP